MSEIPEDVMTKAEALIAESLGTGRRDVAAMVARAIMAERERWKPAVTYFNRYCLDEADDIDNCLVPEQHEDAKAFAAVVTTSKPAPSPPDSLPAGEA